MCHGNGNAESVMEMFCKEECCLKVNGMDKISLGESCLQKRPVNIMEKFPIEVCPVVNIFQRSQQKLSVLL